MSIQPRSEDVPPRLLWNRANAFKMSDFKFDGQKLDVDLIASIAKLLDSNGIPNVMWGPYVLARFGAPLILQVSSVTSALRSLTQPETLTNESIPGILLCYP
jgi:hypothetical protein